MYIRNNGRVVNDGALIVNGQMQGELAGPLGNVRFDPGLLRPYYDKRGRQVVTLRTGRLNADGTFQKAVVLVNDLHKMGVQIPSYITNAQTLTKQSWIELDRAVIRAYRQRLKAWMDLEGKNPRGGFDAMGRLTLEYQNMSDPGEAVVDMDGISPGRNDRPLFNLLSVPLAITHSDFWFSAREIAVSQNSGVPLDTAMAEACGRRIGEMVERTLIGTETGLTFGTQSGNAAVAHTGTSTVYGYTNYPYRMTKTDLTTPTGSNPEAVMTDILEMTETMRSNGFFGPYMVYHSTGYSRYFEDDYYRSGSTSAVRTLKERIMAIDGIAGLERLDYLTSGFQLIMIQMDPEIVQAINGMDVTTVQWESRGGMQQNFKVMCIKVPLLKTPYNGVTGILHGTTA